MADTPLATDRHSEMATKHTREIAAYMEQRMRTESAPVPLHWDVQLLIDCDQCASVVKEAKQNTLSTKWDVVDMLECLSPKVTGTNEAFEDAIMNWFPPLPAQHITAPTIITDRRGRILLCYLPDIISENTYALLWGATERLPFHVSLKSTSWRFGSKHYRSAGPEYRREGSIDIAPATFMQGHSDSVHISTKLQPQQGQLALWSRKMYKTFAMFGGVLKLIQPHQFEVTCATLEAMHKTPDLVSDPIRLRQILSVWPAPFHGVSIMSNRSTPAHRDSNGIDSGMDLLVPMGESVHGTFTAHTLGLTFAYKPRSIILLAGKVVRHSADVDGDRVCIAFYSRKKIHEWVGGKDPKWSTIHKK